MPLDDTGQAPPEVEAPAPAPAAPVSVNDRIAASRKAGYSDDDIRAYLQQSKTWGPKYQASIAAGYKPEEVWAHLGLPIQAAQPTAADYAPNPQIPTRDEDVPDSAGKRVVQAGIAKAGDVFKNREPFLTPKAQAYLDEKQRQGGITGALAQAGSTVADDLGAALAVPGAAFAGAQGALDQFGQEIGVPQLGPAVGALQEAFPQESFGQHGVLNRKPHLPADAAKAIAEGRQIATNPEAAQAAAKQAAGQPPPEAPAGPPADPNQPAPTFENRALTELDPEEAPPGQTTQAKPSPGQVTQGVPESEPVPAAPSNPAPTEPPAPTVPDQPLYQKIPKEPTRLVQFLRQPWQDAEGNTHPGGIRDDGGDVNKSIGGSKGRPGLLNAQGDNLDNATLRAWLAGYLPEWGDTRPDINALLDKISEDHNGEPIYSMHDQDAAQAHAEALKHNDEVDKLADLHGIDPAGKTRGQFYDELADKLSLDEAQHEAQRQADAHDAAYRDAEAAAKQWMAYHGTPAEFDKFDKSAIGSGEGNQAFGHGFYFAENPDVAGNYRKNISGQALIDKVSDVFADHDNLSDAQAAIVSAPNLTPKEARFLRALKADDWLGFDYPQQAIKAALDKPENFDPSPELLRAAKDLGNQYAVRLHALPEDFIHWDKPLSEQPRIVDKLDALHDQHGIERLSEDELGQTGKDYLDRVDAITGSQEGTADLLSSAGVKGVRYLDGGSRKDGVGTHNVVVFDPRDIEVTHRNGEPVAPEAWNAKDFYGQGQGRTLEDLEREHQQIDASQAGQQRAEGHEESRFAGRDQGAVPEGGEPRGGGARVGESDAQAEERRRNPRNDPNQIGLFDAPRQAPPAAAPRPAADRPTVSRFRVTGDKDLLHEYPHPEPGQNPHQVAANWVLKKGAETGHEFAVFIHNETGEAVHATTQGKVDAVGFTPDFGSDVDAYSLHHNHPGATGLSRPDLGLLAYRAVSHIIAHGADGSVSFARLADGARRHLTALNEFQRQQKIYAEVNKIDREMLPRVQALADSRVVPYGVANQFFADTVNRAFAATGLVDYVSSHQLPDVMAGALSRYLRGKGYDPRAVDRSTVAVRADQAVAGLPERVAGQPGREPARSQASPAPSQPGTPAQGRLFEQSREHDLSALHSFPGPLFSLSAWRQAFGLPPLAPKAALEILADKKGISKAIAEFKAAFSPTSMGGAKPMERAIREHTGKSAQDYDQSYHALEKVRLAVDRLSQQEQVEFTHRYETGQAQPTPELQAVADALRGQLEGWGKKVQSLGKGYLANAIENYMGHIWGNYREWTQGLNTTLPPAQMLTSAIGRNVAKKPLQGSGNFLKQRVFPTQLDGLNAGLIPVTYNPVDLQLIKIHEIQKFYNGSILANNLKTSGLAHWIRESDYREAEHQGLVKLDDKVFQPKLYGVAAAGPVEPGAWHSSEPLARVFNNYMSTGWYGKSTIYDGIRVANGAMNTLQLGLSGFHAAFVTADTIISKVALGIDQVAAGHPVRGAGNIAKGLLGGPAIVVATARKGGEFKRAWLDPRTATPEMQQVVEAVKLAGGRFQMHDFYRNSASGAFYKSLSDLKNPASALYSAAQMFRDAPNVYQKAVMTPLRLVGRMLDQINEPLMGALVPRAKAGVFADLAQEWIRNNPGASRSAMADAMIKIQDTVDNRLGQLNYDNLFWNKKSKDLAFITTRSVGWNLGTVREIGGGAVDTAQLARGKGGWTHRMSYTIALPIVTAEIGAILTYLATGAAPTSLLDYFYPPTGTTNDQGQGDRRNIPGYMKDVVAAYKDLPGTVQNKASPLLSTATQVWHNRDYYGGTIFDPKRDLPAQAYGNFLLNQMDPFSLRSFMMQHEKGAAPLDQALSFWGFQQAPKSITAPQRGEHFADRDRMRGDKARTKEKGRIELFDQRRATP